MEYVTVHGENIPVLGFGTWQISGSGATKSIKNALEIGYRHIDTAQMYDNEKNVGQAIAEANIGREDIFLTTKIRRTNLHYDEVMETFGTSLEKLQTDYVDLLLIHWPNENIPLEETLDAMNELKENGKVNHIGVSNFTVQLMKKAKKISDSPLFGNQVEYHPFLPQREVLNYCQEHDLILTAYSPLSRGKVLTNETLKKIGDKYGKTPAQVTLRWHVQQENVIAIPKAQQRHHQEENIDIFDFQLTQKEMQKISNLGSSERNINPPFAPW